MKEVAFVSVAFSERYISQQIRLRQSIVDVYGEDANIFMWCDKLPPGARPFLDSLYGFKPHAIKQALDAGFNKVCYFDTAIILQDKVDYYQDKVKDYGVIAVADETQLHKVCSRKALRHFNLQKHEILKWKLVGGSFYYFDFDLPLCQTIFNKWMEAEQKGLFGSQSDEAMGLLEGHRHDETVMALALYTSGSRPMSEDTRYNCEGGIMIKKHFK